ncbi:MAG: DUF3943 domain-containing protein, partial [Myxococcales bacterium]|nr:DUF3943 domain-containing protein [Myxococcales bacterium]
MIKQLHLVGLTVAALAAPAWAGEDSEVNHSDADAVAPSGDEPPPPRASHAPALASRAFALTMRAPSVPAAMLSFHSPSLTELGPAPTERSLTSPTPPLLSLHSPSLIAPLLTLRTRSRPEPSLTWPSAPHPPGATPAAPSPRAPVRETDDDELHVGAALTWAGIELAIPGWYYWHTKDEQKVDWADPSWADKLTLRAVRFDTNAFHVNAIRHPLAGTGDYQIARSNGFGMLGSTLFAYLAGAFWELCVEYREDPSANDLIMNGAGGLAIGEPFYQIGQLWRGSHPSLADRLRTAAFSPFAAAQD